VCGELPTPEAGHGEMRVRLEASGVKIVVDHLGRPDAARV